MADQASGEQIREAVRERYSAAARQVLEHQSASCCSDATCCGPKPQIYDLDQLDEVPEAAALASLGCGNPTLLAELKEGETVLDLGSGGGIDVLLSARRVGPTGRAYGLDMTDEMLGLARENARKAGVANVEFLKGQIEAIPLPDESVDVIISNCVINLSADKDAVLREAYRVLKPGGRFAVADIVVQGGPLPEPVRRMMSLWAGCVAGALSEEEYGSKLAAAGFQEIEMAVLKTHGLEEVPEEMSSCLPQGASLPDGSRVTSSFIRATRARRVEGPGEPRPIEIVQKTTGSLSPTSWRLPALLITGGLIWLAAYLVLPGLAEFLTYTMVGLDPVSRFGSAVGFFLYNAPKILLLLILVSFLMGLVRSFFSPERTRKLLGGKREGVGNLLAATLGIVTPFCSCSAVPLFLGFVESGVPLGVTFSFLVAAPMINYWAVALLFGLFGWQVAALYVSTGLAIAIVAGWVIGRLRLERYVEEWVYQVRVGESGLEGERLAFEARVAFARDEVRKIVGRVWPFATVGIAVGAAIRGYVAEDLMVGLMGKEAWWSVPAAVVAGIPMYAGSATIIPILQALMQKGAALGTSLAFMMSVIGLSLPEMIIIRKVLKVQLIAVFIGVVGAGIVLTGYLFNLVIP